MFVKLLTRLFYRTEAQWLTPKDEVHWEQLRLLAVLNHTSLFEPLFAAAFPNYRLWRASKRLIMPIADVTMSRPFVGSFFKVLVPGAIPITRKRDETWDYFMKRAKEDSLVLIFPEGRMKRKDGFDKHGKPMSVKGGIADIIQELDTGYLLLAYSAGLHHVQAPGDYFPRLFQRIKISFEEIEIAQYKKHIASLRSDDFRLAVITDLEARMAKHCNECEKS